MSKSFRAFLFPGQGSQYVGMGKELAASFGSAREVFAELDDVLSERLSAKIFSGTEEDLRLTRNTQPALLAVSVAVMRVLSADFSVNLLDFPVVMAGHSLGEYSALTLAGVVSYADSVRLLRIRGEAMQASVADGEGMMAAILGLDVAVVSEVADAASEGSMGSRVGSRVGSRDESICVVANDNADGQVVISGTREAVERAIELAKDRGARRAIGLEVSAPFHSPLMRLAEEQMRSALSDVSFSDSRIDIYTNVTASAERSGERLRELLLQQICARVRWRETLLALEVSEVEYAYEIGAGRALSGMVRRTTPSISCSPVLSLASLEQAAKELC